MQRVWIDRKHLIEGFHREPTFFDAIVATENRFGDHVSARAQPLKPVGMGKCIPALALGIACRRQGSANRVQKHGMISHENLAIVSPSHTIVMPCIMLESRSHGGLYGNALRPGWVDELPVATRDEVRTVRQDGDR